MDYYNNDNQWNHDPFSPQPGQEGPDFPGGPKKKERKPMSRKTKHALKIVAVCLVCVLAGASIHPLASVMGGKNETTLYAGSREPTQLNVTEVNTEKEMTTEEIYGAYSASCVGITVDIVSTNIFGQTVTGAAAGSGFVITENGYILTNYHVIEGANSITVTFVDGKQYPATVVGGEAENDIAVIKIEATGLKPVVIGKSSDMLVGEQVTTIGNPLGELTFSQTAGIISALNRTVTMSNGQQMNMIQTDCAINSGNSGGPLFNSHGEVIGIVSAKLSSNGSSSSASVEGLGFAIPMDDVASMVSDLVNKGYVTGKPVMGVIMEDVDQQVQAYGIPAGVLVGKVSEGMPAAKAGLKDGDIITKIDDTEVKSRTELAAAVDQHKPGDQVTLTVYRSGETLTVKVTLEESTPETEAKQEEDRKAYQEQRQQQQQQQQQGSGGWSYNFGY
ncbi:MAG: trypsin-like peptidase domain-containing protein [Evtepia sp.]|uniref:S1C family serine protease n=1 Tax=Evtepia sp. TaxID=2773933 RepID=UPI002A760BBD|nr:trypsin-like peptidase domain-containing protein [Evtepia sp.]MDY3014294.1 trypsin-like peptidase domain-containing protein [Evtepia sp.]